MRNTRLRDKFITIAVMVLICSLLCGLDFLNPFETYLNTDENKLYQHISADMLIDEYRQDDKGFKEKWQDRYYAVSDVVGEKKDNGKEIRLCGTSAQNAGDEVSIICNTSAVKNEIRTLQTGDTVQIHGLLSVDLLHHLNLKAEKLMVTDGNTAVRMSEYSTLNGTTINTDQCIRRTLTGDGAVSYSIPKSWAGIEHDLQAEELGEMPGFQYRLNELPGEKQTVEPESFFICYFDNNEMLESPGERGKTDLIEKAIIANILKKAPDDSSIRTHKKKTYYGAEYHYYEGQFAKSALDKPCRLEFAFQPVGSKGILVYLYVFDKPLHKDEALFVMRFAQ